MSERYDVVVVGAGPGGMAAAAIAAEGGRRVCLIDENAMPGGQIWRGYEKDDAAAFPHGLEFVRWRKRLASSGAAVWGESRVIAAPERNTLRVERGDGC